MSQKLVPWEGSWPSSLAWILLIGQTALFAWSQDKTQGLQYYLSSYWPQYYSPGRMVFPFFWRWDNNPFYAELRHNVGSLHFSRDESQKDVEMQDICRGWHVTSASPGPRLSVGVSTVSAVLVSALHRVAPPGPLALVTQVRVHYRVVTRQEGWGTQGHQYIIIPGVPTHPGNKLSAPATTGHTALRGRSMGPDKSGIRK